jgi:hypothetical protein
VRGRHRNRKLVLKCDADSNKIDRCKNVTVSLMCRLPLTGTGKLLWSRRQEGYSGAEPIASQRGRSSVRFTRQVSGQTTAPLGTASAAVCAGFVKWRGGCCYLTQQGVRFVDDIRQAQQRQDKAHVLTLLHALHHFLKSHPEVCPAQHPWSKLY